MKINIHNEHTTAGKSRSFFCRSFLVFVFVFAAAFAHAQGCSDAGLCSFGSMNILGYKYVNLPLDQTRLSTVDVVDTGLNGALGDTLHPVAANDSAHTIQAHTDLSADTIAPDHLVSCEFTTYYGAGEQGTSVFITQLEGNFNLINQKLYGQVKLPYSIISGKLGNTNGLGDITMSLSYVAFRGWRSNLSIAAGVKLPSNSSNLSLDNRPLPMVYQTSLGSTDLLLGTRFSFGKWDFAAGYQHSFNANANRYVHSTLFSDSLVYNAYAETDGFRRADDGVFRINRKFQVNKSYLSTSLLFIYHMANDDYTNAAGQRLKAINSQGLTLNLDVAGNIPVSKNAAFTFIIAKPLVQRKNAPDGLSRSFVGIVGIKRNF